MLDISSAPGGGQPVGTITRQAPPPWASGEPPQSGCDSSDCSYCHKMAKQRRLQGRRTVCWLRRKRSQTDLEALAAARGGGGDADAGGSPAALSLPRPASSSTLLLDAEDSGSEQPSSMWDEALLEPGAARRILAGAGAAAAAAAARGAPDQGSPRGGGGGGGSGRWVPWSVEPWMPARPTPVPGALLHVGSFRAAGPGPCGLAGGDIVCGMEFEEHGWLLATAGVAKQLAVYSLASCLQGGAAAPPGPVRVHRLSSKLSSLAWNPDQPGVVTVGDYDGVVSQVDLESGHLVAEAEGHSGRRVWSVTHSLLRPHLAASASDDGRAVLWAGAGLAGEVGAARPAGGASVTAVHLSPHDENLLAVGCADSAAYVYDLRRLAAPLEALRGHARPVSYVRFMGRSRLVTASTDASLACWDLAGAGRGGDGDGSGSGSGAGGGSDASDLLGAGGGRRAARRFRGHTNSKNFVGLSVRPEDGLVACGSESSQVFAYSLNWDQPLAAHDFGGGPPAAGAVAAARAGFAPFCTAVCWQAATACPGGEPLLAAATSDGGLRVLALRKRQLREEER